MKNKLAHSILIAFFFKVVILGKYLNSVASECSRRKIRRLFQLHGCQVMFFVVVLLSQL